MRLDQYIVSLGLQESRERTKQAIISGQVYVDGVVITTPSHKVNGTEAITFGENMLKYVSRGALKLKKACEVFDVNFSGRNVLDIGSSTGGFTEVALEQGASRVVALDVGNNILHLSLRDNPNVTVMENTDFRTVDAKKISHCDLIVTDVSFISLKHIFPRIKQIFGDIEIIALFKPQFECGEKIAKKYKGVIKDKSIHKALLNDFSYYVKELNFELCELDFSPIKGKEGNIEYLLHINGKTRKHFNISDVVDMAFAQ